MPANRDDVWKLLTYIQDDLRQTQTKLVELRSMLAAGALDRQPEDTHECPKCGAVLKTERALAFHDQNVHDGPPVPLNETERAA